MKLTKSQRVKIIKDVANHLDLEDWTTIDLTLRGFGFPITDQWSGRDKVSYVIDMLREPADADLIELGQHLGMPIGDQNSNPGGAPETPYWRDGQLRVFISHLTTQREQAAKIQEAMQWNGMSGFVAHNDINPTVEWQIEIETALTTCDLLVALIHLNSLKANGATKRLAMLWAVAFLSSPFAVAKTRMVSLAAFKRLVATVKPRIKSRRKCLKLRLITKSSKQRCPTSLLICSSTAAVLQVPESGWHM